MICFIALINANSESKESPELHQEILVQKLSQNLNLNMLRELFHNALLFRRLHEQVFVILPLVMKELDHFFFNASF
jgi:hypothetical protein